MLQLTSLDYPPSLSMNSTLRQWEGNATELMSIESEIKELSDTLLAIKIFGLNTTSLLIMKTTGLLAGTSLNSIALESLCSSDVDESIRDIAVENIISSIKDKVAKWSAKILESLKSTSGKITESMTHAFGKIKDTMSHISQSVLDKSKYVSRKMNAIPHKRVLLTLASIGAVSALLLFAGRSFPKVGANPSEVSRYLAKLKDMISKIKSPFCILTPNVLENGKLSVHVLPADIFSPSSPPIKLGWTDTTIKSTSHEVSNAVSSMSSSWKVFESSGISISKSISSKIASTLARESFDEDDDFDNGSSSNLFLSVVSTIYQIIKAVVIIGLMTIGSAYSLFKYYYNRTSVTV